MRNVEQWLDDYGDSHRNRTNKLLHWVCVPVIVWCVIALLWSLPTATALPAPFNWAVFAVAAALVYYTMLSLPLALGALVFLIAMLLSIPLVQHSGVGPLWRIGAILFVLAWIGQFIGHHIEGKRPSFLKDIQFLMIGPLWLLASLYRRFGIRY
jgi:uncharacterized membrane protein YGL010W